MATVASGTRGWEELSQCLLCRSDRLETLDAEYHVCRCQACGYVFDNPRPTIETIVDFYSKPGQYNHWIAAEGAREHLWKRRVGKLLKYTRRGKLLDVGTGIGQFLNAARPFFDEVSGTEVSESAVEVAKQKYDLEIAHGKLEACNLRRNHFDTITLFHVLEHVPDPTDTLSMCRDLLNRGGLLVVCVPNDVLAWTSKLKAAGRKLGLGFFQRFSPKLGIPQIFSTAEIHLSHFTPRVLRRALEGGGFSIVDESLDPYYAETGMRLALHSTYYALHRLLFAVTRANRYDTIWMVARKSGGYRIEEFDLQCGNDGPIKTIKVVWEKGRVRANLDDLLSESADKDDSSALGEGIDWLKAHLDVQKESAALIAEAKQDGVSWSTIKRAKEKLGLKPFKDGDHWVWPAIKETEQVQ